MEKLRGLEQVDFLQNVPVQASSQLRLLADECGFTGAGTISAQREVANSLYLLLAVVRGAEKSALQASWGWIVELLPNGQLNLGTLHILMPVLLSVGLGFSWFLLQRLLVNQTGSATAWLPARLFLLNLGVLLLWLL